MNKMLKSLLIIYLLSNSFELLLGTSFQALMELTHTLSMLQYLESTKIIPSQAYYDTLRINIETALKHKTYFLDTSHPSDQAALYLISIAKNISSEKTTDHLMLSYHIIFVVQLYDQIRLKHTTNNHLIITSLSTGPGFHEKLLLHLLKHFGFNSLTFYSIDPRSTKEGMEQLKSEFSLKNAQAFTDSKEYIHQMIKLKGEIPNICLSAGPPLLPNDLILGKENNICWQDEPQGAALLIAPRYISEVSLETGDNSFVQFINSQLRSAEALSLPSVKLATLNEFKDLRCGHSVLINFLEIIKLASTQEKDCIAGCKRGIPMHIYHNIAHKSIGQLFRETPPYSFLSIDRTNFALWLYNPQSHQFEAS